MSQSTTAEASSSSSQETPPSSITSSPTTQAGLAESRAAINASLTAVGSAYNTDLQRRVADLHANAKAIEKQEKDVAKQTQALQKETAKWAKLADKTTKQLNEFGDIQNWAEVLERDLCVLEETVRLVEGGADEGNESGVNRLPPPAS